MRKKGYHFLSALLLLLSLSALTPLLMPSSPGGGHPDAAQDLNWRREKGREYYEEDELYGYIDGGAEIFYDYGFRELFISRYVAWSSGEKKELTLEVYHMSSPENAYGIFSVKRTGEEKVSEQIDIEHWVGETQLNMVKAEFFINIVGFNTTAEELEQFAVPIPGRVLGQSRRPRLLDLLPEKNRIERSQRYIKGQGAASGESVLLRSEFWGFKGRTRAVSARYSPSNSKLIILDFREEKTTLAPLVGQLFLEYVDEVEIKEDVVIGTLSFDHYFLFKQKGKMGVLLLGERDADAARELLELALERI